MPNSGQDAESRLANKTRWLAHTAGRWAVVLVVAMLVRGGVVMSQSGNLRDDPDAYRKLAETLRQTGVFGVETVPSQASGGADREIRPTAFRPPLYPLVLAAIATHGAVSPLAVAALHWVLGVATVGLTFALARRFRLRSWSWLAAMLVACDPILLNQSTLVMTETIATFLATTALWFLAVTERAVTERAVTERAVTERAVTERAVTERVGTGAGSAGARNQPHRPRHARRLVLPWLAGVTIGLGVLSRPTFLPWLALVVLASLGWRARYWRTAMMISLGAMATLAPWAIRNQLVIGSPKATTTHGGYTLLLGNNAEFYRFLDSGRGSGGLDVWDSTRFDQQWDELRGVGERSELADDRLAYALAWRSISEQPEMFVWSCAVRVGRLWRCVPHQVSASETTVRMLARSLIGFWYVAVFLLAAAGVLSLGRDVLKPPWVCGILLCVTFTAVHALYWSNMRMRAPLMPVVCLLAAAGAGGIANRVERRK